MILITGVSGGIGKFLYQEFKKIGEDIYGTYFETNGNFGSQNNFFQLDVTDFKKAQSIVEGLTEKIKNLVLINCAGDNYDCYAHKSSQEEWHKVIEINLIGTYNMIRAVLPIMRVQNFGRIINFSSVVAELGIPGTSAYAASKAGLWGMSKSIAVENASKGITINNLNLGYFDIGMIKEISEDYKKIIKKRIPTGEFGNPQNIFYAVKFLIDSDYINGASIDINGGIF